MRKPRLALATVLFLLSLCAPTAWGQDGLGGALSREPERTNFTSRVEQEIVAADFDSDQRPDGAVLLEVGNLNGEKAYRIELHLSAGQNSAIVFASTESQLSLATLDVNRDGIPDIVIEKALTHKRLQVYLNDGHGGFRKASDVYPAPDDSVPQSRSGVNPSYPSNALLARARGLDMASKSARSRPKDHLKKLNYWSEAMLNRCAARAPTKPRAPPSILPL